MQYQYIPRYLINLMVLLPTTNFYAAQPVWTFSAPSPASITISSEEKNTIHYTVTNQSAKSKTLLLKSTKGLSAAPCILPYRGSTCDLTIAVNGSALSPIGIHQGPILCEQSNPNQCYKPSPDKQLNINKITIFPVVLVMDSTEVSFVAGEISNTITITNSSRVAAAALVLTPSSNINLVNNTCPSVLAAQASCSFALTSSVASTNNTVIIQGKNTNKLILPVTVTQAINLTTVGLYREGGRLIPLAYTSSDSGLSWIPAIAMPPAQGNANNILRSVFCDEAGLCSAVGNYFNGSDSFPLSYISIDNGINWLLSAMTPPALGNNSALYSVSCVGNQCTTVGFYTSSGRQIPLSYVSADKGAHWALSTTLPPPMPGNNNVLQSISCDNLGHCAAVGYYADITNPYRPLSYFSHDYGVNWTISTTMPPAQGNYDNFLQSVSCNNSQHCVAVGQYFNGGIQYLVSSYVSNDGGDHWQPSITSPPAQGNVDNFLSSVSCDNLDRCIATGAYNDGNLYRPLSYFSRDNGQNWLRSAVLPPAQGSSDIFLNGLFCKMGQCITVGHADNNLLLSYISYDYGNTWDLSPGLPPILGNDSQLASVSGH